VLGGSTCSQVLRDVPRPLRALLRIYAAACWGCVRCSLASLDSVHQSPARLLTIPLACISETVRQRLVSAAEKLAVRCLSKA
jgi:hypothetical protein